MSASDVQLLLASRRGNQAAARSLWERHAPRLAAYVRSILRNPEDAEDVLQGVFCSALQLPEARMREVHDFAPFLTRLARNAAVNLLRTQRRSRRRDRAAAGARVLTVDHAADAAGGLASDVRALPRRHREVIVLRYVAGLTFEQIADALGTSKSTVASRHQAAIGALRVLHARSKGSSSGASRAEFRRGEVLHVR